MDQTAFLHRNRPTYRHELGRQGPHFEDTPNGGTFLVGSRRASQPDNPPIRGHRPLAIKDVIAFYRTRPETVFRCRPGCHYAAYVSDLLRHITLAIYIIQYNVDERPFAVFHRRVYDMRGTYYEHIIFLYIGCACG